MDNQFEEERGIIIKNFMIEDNISYESYHANAKWQWEQLSMERNDRLLLECTPTYRKHYSSGFGRKLFNDELGHGNDWFYFAYPDVAHWFESNYDEITVTLK